MTDEHPLITALRERGVTNDNEGEQVTEEEALEKVQRIIKEFNAQLSTGKAFVTSVNLSCVVRGDDSQPGEWRMAIEWVHPEHKPLTNLNNQTVN